MALLDFLFDKQRRAPRGQDAAPVPAPPVTSSAEKARETILDGPSSSSHEPNIDRIRSELEAIADLIGPGDSYNLLSADDDQVTALNVKACDVVALASDAFSPEGREAMDPEQQVTILVSDLFEQLSNGDVNTTLGQLVADLEPELLASNINDIRDRKVSLPLPLVVSAVRPDELAERTTKLEREPELDQMPDVFSRLDDDDDTSLAQIAPEEDVDLFNPEDVTAETPASVTEPETESEAADLAGLSMGVEEEEDDEEEKDAVSVEAEDTVIEEIEAVAIEQTPPEEEAVVSDLAVALDRIELETDPVADSSLAFSLDDEATPDLAPSDDVDLPASQPVEAETYLEETVIEEVTAATPVEETVPDAPEVDPVMVGGINVNRAAAGDFVTRLDGIGPKMGVRIVEDRELNGPFADAYDLSRVQGIGRKTFETITGLAWREDLCGNMGLLSEILESSRQSIPDIRAVANRVAQIKGYEGCVIAYRDGYVLATSWDHKMNETLGAFAPQMFKKVVAYIKRLKLGGMDAFTFFFEDHPVTLVNSGDIFLAAIHTPGRFSRRHVQIARTLTAELARRLKRFGKQ